MQVTMMDDLQNIYALRVRGWFSGISPRWMPRTTVDRPAAASSYTLDTPENKKPLRIECRDRLIGMFAVRLYLY